ncbi:ig-like domain-containing protein [Caerostris extrusa]|uniref:Ig-like domain-containing protein n=1 Tax=Caerostris extrusa TaxID=172846 RepID=A0AAV4RZV5_CAEEX|nr:ig-like domain-containing protein [Caerostris extrusa]
MQMPWINLERRAQEEILKSAGPKRTDEVCEDQRVFRSSGGLKILEHKVQSYFSLLLFEIEYPEMHAVIGSTVSLPCNLSPPSPDDSFSLVLWYRLDLPNPIYTLDARSATAPSRCNAFRQQGAGRPCPGFNISTQRPSAASLTLENVSESDAGEYRCRVDFRRGRTLSWLVKLNVIEIKLMISNIVESVERDSLHPICSILRLAPMARCHSPVHHLGSSRCELLEMRVDAALWSRVLN